MEYHNLYVFFFDCCNGLRTVDVHMLNLSNNGIGFDQERVIVLTRNI